MVSIIVFEVDFILSSTCLESRHLWVPKTISKTLNPPNERSKTSREVIIYDESQECSKRRREKRLGLEIVKANLLETLRKWVSSEFEIKQDKMKNQENQCTRLSDWDWQQKRKTFDISNEFFWYVYVKLILLLTFGRWRISTVGLKIIKHRAVSLAPLILLDCGNKRISAENWFFFCYLHFRLKKTADDAHEFVTKTNHIVRRLQFSSTFSFRFPIDFYTLLCAHRKQLTIIMCRREDDEMKTLLE